MTQAERWMLPDGIAEILPESAKGIETLRRTLLDLYHTWGYALIIPPMVEFTDSLLIGMGRDIDLSTFRVTDQLSGRSLGIRADMTPQAARIDAHSLPREGANRLCYAGQILYTRPRTAMGSRAPIQIGAELFGVASLQADIEIISLLVETLLAAEVHQIHLDLGHIAIYRSLAEAAGLTPEQGYELFALLQTKAVADIESWIAAQVVDPLCAEWLCNLPHLVGEHQCLVRARTIYAAAPAALHRALEELQQVMEALEQRYPTITVFFDLSEARGYDYETGLVFAAYTPGCGQALANGGRYNGIGAVFGRDRPATGFSTDLEAIHNLANTINTAPVAIYAPTTDCQQLWQQVQALRAQGEVVIFAMPDSDEILARCNRQLVRNKQHNSWELQPLTLTKSSKPQ